MKEGGRRYDIDTILAQLFTFPSLGLLHIPEKNPNPIASQPEPEPDIPRTGDLSYYYIYI